MNAKIERLIELTDERSDLTAALSKIESELEDYQPRRDNVREDHYDVYDQVFTDALSDGEVTKEDIDSVIDSTRAKDVATAQALLDAQDYLHN